MEIVKNDNRLINKPTNLIYKLYWDYLNTAISLFFRDCYKDITNNIPFSQIEYKFIANGTDDDFLLESPNIPPDNSLFYVGYSSGENVAFIEVPASKYTYNSTTHVLTTDIALIPSGSIVYISAYIIGEFIDTLDYDEINILKEGCLIPFLQEQQNKISLLNQLVYGNQKLYSQAEHLKQVKDTVVNQENKVISMITKYSYRANPDKLKYLGGGN